jgi:nitronate monooxygenase
MDLLQTLGLQVPVIQAPMAGHQAGAMALAVSEAGGLGSLPCATLSAEGIGRELQTLAEATDRPVNVNFFVHEVPPEDHAREMAWRTTLAPWYAEFGIDAGAIRTAPGRSPFDAAAAEVLARFRPRVVSFHFGLPAPDLLARVKSWGSLVMASATTVDEARWLEARGADIIIAQGVEAGGHRGMFLSEDITTQMGTLTLVPQVVRAVRLPVVAAGGIADAAGVRAALTLGASAAQVGTTFLLCPEATISEVHRRALASPAAGHTALTNLFTGRPARGIFNRAMRELGSMRDDVPRFPLATTAMAPLRSAAEAAGSGDFSPLWSGQNASGCRPMPAGWLARALGGLD